MLSKFESGLAPELTLRGQHAMLEPMQISSCEALIEAAADGHLWNLKVTQVPSPEQMSGEISDALDKKARGEQFPFVICRLEDEKVVGSTRYYQIDALNRNLSIGFTWYSKSAQRTAINTECKLLLLSHAFENLGCISVAFHVDGINHVSQAAVKRLGASHEGILRNHKIMPDGRIRHTHCFSIIDSEWPHIKQQLEQRLARD